MLRLLAGILILCGSIGLSLQLCHEMRERLKYMEQMQEILRLFQADISYSKAAFPEVCLAVSDRVTEPYKTALKDIYVQVAEKSGTQFPEIWRETMEKYLKEIPVKKEEQEIFLEFGNRMGFMDWETQAGMIEKSRMQLESLYLQLKNVMENKEKVITSMGILGGLMLVIILI